MQVKSSQRQVCAGKRPDATFASPPLGLPGGERCGHPPGGGRRGVGLPFPTPSPLPRGRRGAGRVPLPRGRSGAGCAARGRGAARRPGRRGGGEGRSWPLQTPKVASLTQPWLSQRWERFPSETGARKAGYRVKDALAPCWAAASPGAVCNHPRPLSSGQHERLWEGGMCCIPRGDVAHLKLGSL